MQLGTGLISLSSIEINFCKKILESVDIWQEWQLKQLLDESGECRKFLFFTFADSTALISGNT
jgi:hypothetical protein